MLATCVLNGWSTEDYLDPTTRCRQRSPRPSPSSPASRSTVVAVDGCGAPLLSTSLIGLARAFRALAVATVRPRAARSPTRSASHPAYVSGTTRDELALLTAIPGCDRQGGRGVLLRGGAGRRSGVRAEDRRRRPAGATGADGRGARALGRPRARRASTRSPYAGPESYRCSVAGSRSGRSARRTASRSPSVGGNHANCSLHLLTVVSTMEAWPRKQGREDRRRLPRRLPQGAATRVAAVPAAAQPSRSASAIPT